MISLYVFILKLRYSFIHMTIRHFLKSNILCFEYTFKMPLSKFIKRFKAYLAFKVKGVWYLRLVQRKWKVRDLDSMLYMQLCDTEQIT